jgi:PAS domain S-box-containing protein
MFSSISNRLNRLLQRRKSPRMQLEHARRQEAVVARLASSKTIDSGDLRAAACEISQLVAETLEVERTSIWLRTPEHPSSFACIALYRRSRKSFELHPALDASLFPKYFGYLVQGRTINAPHARRDVRLAEFLDNYLSPNKVASLLDSPVHMDGKLAGIVCCEHVGETDRVWTDDEARFTGEIADAMARSLICARRKETEDALAASQKRLTEIINFLPDATFIIDHNKKVVYWNRAIELMSGVKAADMLGKGDLDYAIPFYGYRRPILIDLVSITDDEIEKKYLDIRRDGDSIFAESFIPCLGANGSYLWGVARALTDSEGRFIGAIESIRDVSTRRRMDDALKKAHDELEQRVKDRTSELAESNSRLLAEIVERKEAVVKLREANRLLEGMLNGIPDIVGFQLPDHSLLRFNRAGHEALKIEPGSEIGQKCYDLFGTSQQCPDCSFKRALAENRVITTERFMPKMGCHMECRCIPIMNEQGQVAVVIEQLRDITERKKHENDLRRAHDELEQRVTERTAELAQTNDSLKALLLQQEVNIDLSHQVLSLINSVPPRNTDLPNNLNLFIIAHYYPCHAAGGDHFFVRNLASGGKPRTILSLKDQSGHEVGCILRSIMTDLIHNALLNTHESLSLEKVITRLNDEICASDLFSEGDFFTSINAELDHETLRLQFLSTGHPAFLLIRGAEVFSLPEVKGAGANLPVGLLGNRVYSAGEAQLAPGDKLLFYTDGLLDAPRQNNGETMSPQQLQQAVLEMVVREPRLCISDLVHSLFKNLGIIGCQEDGKPSPQQDDIAVLGLELEPDRILLKEVIRPHDADELSLASRTLLEQIHREWVENGIQQAKERLGLVIEEALLNAWQHGNRCIPGKPIVVRRHYGNDALIEVLDDGKGFDYQAIYDPTSFENLSKPSGRGLFIIRMLAEEVKWNCGGKAISMFFGRDGLVKPEKKGGLARKNRLELWKIWK